MNRPLFMLSVLMLLASMVTARAFASEIDWKSTPKTEVLLIYPGVTSWEFLSSEDHRLGARAIKRGRKSCRHCHLSKEGELDMDVKHIVTGALKMKRSHGTFEPDPIPGKAPTMKANLQAAYDNDYLYLRIEWLSGGNGWKEQASTTTPDRVSLQLNGTEPYFRRYGCFISCHADVDSMPKSPSAKSVLADRYYNNLGRDNVRLYAYYAKDAWNKPKPASELKKRRKDGGVIDLWSIEFSAKETKSMDGAIFSDRLWQKNSSVEGTGEWSATGYSAIFKRKLGNGGPDDVPVIEGSVLSISIAIHDNGTAQRKHYVSFPLTVGLGVDADLKADKVNTE